MRRVLRLPALVALACLALVACGSDDQAADVTWPPSGSVELVDGDELDWSELANADAALWFWAPWCSRCNAEAPEVAEVTASSSDEVHFVGIASRDDVGAMEDFVARHDLGGFPHVNDGSREVWETFGVVEQPAWAFVDDGEVTEVVFGELGGEGLQERIAELGRS